MIPTYSVDLFTDEALDDPYPHYQALRDLGPVVHLAAHDVYVVARYDDVRDALNHPRVFSSGSGVGLNDFINEGGKGTTLMSDGEVHRRQRSVIGRPLTPKALSELQPELHARADRLIDRLVNRGSIDAVPDLAEVIPSTWVPDLLGWPEAGRARLLDWASASFDALGPLNERAMDAGPRMLEMLGFAQQVAEQHALPPGSMAVQVLEAADRGDIDRSQCPMLMIDYLAPSLDTTISAIGNAVWLFSEHPEQWDRLRADPQLVKQAVNEVVRLESPISCFSRLTTESIALSGSLVGAGKRVLLSFASANRDERQWAHPDQFDVGRRSAGHLGFGSGAHACAGMGLARMEIAAVLQALATRVRRIEVGVPVRKVNNLIRSFASLPTTLHPA